MQGNAYRFSAAVAGEISGCLGVGDAAAMSDLYIGLMSGTSLDGIDGVLVDFSGIEGGAVRVVAAGHRAFDASLRAELLALNTSGPDEIHRAALAANSLARTSAELVASLSASSRRRTGDRIVAVGSHGQTVRHQPGEFDGVGYTVQLNHPARLAELCGIDVVADFRSRDVAAGGQGAPLVPAFHRAVFGRAGEARAVLNIGGIANLSLLASDGHTSGFDCGPGNALLDHWAKLHTGASFDDAGRWAATGSVIETLFTALSSDPFFSARPPKSTGRDRFHAGWLETHLAGRADRPEDVQATLAELTATSCARELLRHAPATAEVLVCGGGAFNDHLMQRLAVALPGIRVMPTDEHGLPATQVEACAFAWLARAFLRRDPGNLSSVTGAAGPRLLGALYPAG